MTRSFDTIPNEADRPADMQKPASPVMSVCPFCGAIAEKSDAPCPRCKMENSALTRQATRARVGPWYVMQSKNPSAPGMKCNTLLALIRKGQITPRSVIRGPTTFQLWRFAARAKGISREFWALLFHAAPELQRTSTFCPALLAVAGASAQPGRSARKRTGAASRQNTGLSGSESASGIAGDCHGDGVEKCNRAARPAKRKLAPRHLRPPTQIPSAAETMAELTRNFRRHAQRAVQEFLQTRPKQRPQEGACSAAARFSRRHSAFSMTRRWTRRPAAGRGAAAAGLERAFSPPRPFSSPSAGGSQPSGTTRPFVNDSWTGFKAIVRPTATNTPAQAPPSKPVPDHTPDWMMTVTGARPPPISTPPKQNSTIPPSVVGEANPSLKQIPRISRRAIQTRVRRIRFRFKPA